MIDREIRHSHFYCGSGGGAKGANKAKAEVGMLKGRFRCIGGIDNDAGAVRDFTRMSGVQGTCLDLFTLEQYVAVHGRAPPQGWREATRTDIHAAMGHERPHVILMSAPCKGFSGLLSEKLSLSAKYQALNQLALRGLHLALDAWGDDPAEFVLFENVPRIQTRGRHLLDQIEQLLSAYGYASAETTHDCGELGNLAQSRKRFLLVARHTEKVPPFLYEPVKRPLRAVGKVLEQLPMPGDVELAGPMHRVPSLHWKTWVRLAFVEAGKDWRSLSRLQVEDGYLKDFAIAPEADYHQGVLGVQQWDESCVTVAGRSSPTNGAFSIADPRMSQSAEYAQLGVRRWSEPTGTVSGQSAVGGGSYSVADPRLGKVKHNNCFRVVRWDEVSCAVTGGTGPSAGGVAVADPRPQTKVFSGYGVTKWEEPAGTVAGESFPSNGFFTVADPRPAWERRSNNLTVESWNDPSRTVIGGGKGVQGGWLSVADPRPGLAREKGDSYLTSGHYGVVPWDKPVGAVTATLQHDNGPGSVADPRLPAPTDKLVAVIRSLDDCWHRPFTTFELAALQGLIDPGERFEMDGNSDSAWRERIGNAIPAPAAEAIFGVIGTTLLLAWSGETFALGSTPIWVRDVAIALSVAQRETDAA